MPDTPKTPSTDVVKVARGQRVRRQTHIGGGHDGKERAHFTLRKRGLLPPDLQRPPGPGPADVEDVAVVPDDASAWEALEDGVKPVGGGH